MLKVYGEKIEIFYTAILVFLQGSVIFSGNKSLLFILFMLGMGIFFLRKKHLDKTFYIVVIALMIVIFAQTIKFSFFSYFTTLGTITRFLFPYFLVRLIGIRFVKHYVNILYFFTIIGLAFYVPSVFSSSFYNTLQKIPSVLGTASFGEGTNFLIYTVEVSTRLGFIRNSGLFWEPGAHSGFLLIAIIFNILLSKKLWSTKNWIFIFAILTTFSTAGYIGLILLISFIYFHDLKKTKSIIILPFIIALSFYLFISLDFLGDKISHEIEMAEDDSREYGGRIGSGQKDLEDIMEHPFFGKGRNVATRFTDYNEENFLRFHRTNGVTDFIVKYGILFSIFYFYNMYKSLRYLTFINNYNVKFAKYIQIIIIVFGFSQTFFQGTFFISLIYLHIAVKDHYAQKRKLAYLNRVNDPQKVENENSYSNTHLQ